MSDLSGKIGSRQRNAQDSVGGTLEQTKGGRRPEEADALPDEETGFFEFEPTRGGGHHVREQEAVFAQDAPRLQQIEQGLL